MNMDVISETVTIRSEGVGSERGVGAYDAKGVLVCVVWAEETEEREEIGSGDA
jgi:hypothetical protein